MKNAGVPARPSRARMTIVTVSLLLCIALYPLAAAHAFPSQDIADAVPTTLPPSVAPDAARLAANYAKLPVLFEMNRGSGVRLRRR